MAGGFTGGGAGQGGAQRSRPTARELRKDTKFRERTKRDHMEYVADSMYKKIRALNAAGWTRMVYTVPATVPGLPLYDIEECTSHLVSSLENDGYIATVYPPQTIYASWDPSECRHQS